MRTYQQHPDFLITIKERQLIRGKNIVFFLFIRFTDFVYRGQNQNLANEKKGKRNIRASRSMSLKKEDESCVQAMLFANSHIFPLVLNAAIELKLFEIMAEAGDGAYVSPSEIASRLPTRNPNAASLVDRMLRLLASHSLLSFTLRTLEDDSGVERLYGLTPTARFFLKGDDESGLASWIVSTRDRALWEVWFALSP